jgi:hypothetical protein
MFRVALFSGLRGLPGKIAFLPFGRSGRRRGVPVIGKAVYVRREIREDAFMASVHQGRGDQQLISDRHSCLSL